MLFKRVISVVSGKRATLNDAFKPVAVFRNSPKSFVALMSHED